MSKQTSVSTIQKCFCMPDIIRHLILSWLLAVLIEYLLLPSEIRDIAGLDGLKHMSLPRVVCITCGSLVLLFCMSRFGTTARWERWGIVCVYAILVVAALLSSFTWPFLIACLLVLGILLVYGCMGWNRHTLTVDTPRKDHKVYFKITIILALLFFLFISAWTVGRVFSFGTGTYDFGIFSQMFYHMMKSGQPLTTLERDGLLSHFAVHVSPIYYLMLPFYWLIPIPATLQVLQAAVLASSVVPLWKLGKLHGLTDVQRMMVCMVLFLHPALSGGTSYDLHENCFLMPLILWLFYGIDLKNPTISAIAALLTLMVKEDAAIYVAVIALWLTIKSVLRHRELDIHDTITGTVMLSLSLFWFFLVIGYLAENGNGVMTYRYNNFIYDGSSSLFTVVKSVILNPLKVVYECVDSEKLQFIAMTLVPLLGLPILTRRYERYILLIPYILINLMSDYPYQHNINFQYSFGSTACLMYLTIVNLADLKINWLRVLSLAVAVVLCVSIVYQEIVPAAVYYSTRSIQNFSHYWNIYEVLQQIPEEASVTASTYYTTPLSQRETVYDVSYCTSKQMLETEYVVLSVTGVSDYKKYATSGQENGFDNLVSLLERNGFELIDALDDVLVVYRKIPLQERSDQ